MSEENEKLPWYCVPSNCMTQGCVEYGRPNECAIRAEKARQRFVDPTHSKCAEDLDEDYVNVDKMLEDGTYVNIVLDKNGLIEVQVTPPAYYEPSTDERSVSHDYYFEVV